jgi:hypothetical protein
LLATLAVVVFVLRPMQEVGLAGALVVEIVFALVLVAGVWTVWTPRAHALAFASAVGIAEVVRWADWAASGAGLAPWAALALSLAMGLLMVLVLQRIFLAGPITGDRIQGAVAVYLLIGLMWAQAYDFLERLVPGSFQFPSAVVGPYGRSSALLYFSFITLTTLGYGDILPVHPVARSLAMVEALMGQLYPAILIAGLVGAHISSRFAGPQR